jgi:hypothetical protein
MSTRRRDRSKSVTPSMAATAEKQAQAAFRDAQQRWQGALETHRRAPPDAGFSARLAGLSDAARAEAAACREAHAAGFEWPPHRASSSKPPYELQPDSGRRGPPQLWRRFDGAVAELNRTTTGTDLIEVADAYDTLAVAATDLAAAVEREDRSSGLLPRARKRRSA